MTIYSRRNRILIAIIAVLISFAAVFMMNAVKVNAETGNATATIRADGGAYMRKSFSTSSAKVTLLKNGTKVTIIRETFASRYSYDTNKRWFYVKANGYSGYVRADLLKDFSYSGDTATVKSSLNYRGGAGTGMKIKGVLKAGDKVDVKLLATPYGTNDTWYKSM